MKATGKIIGRLIVGCAFACCLTSVTPHALAIEGLHISVQSANAVLSWPSTNTETYIVQYRQTLSPADTWATLTDYFPAATGTNRTFFVHSNIVQYSFNDFGDGGTNGGNISPPELEMMDDFGSMSDSTVTVASPAVPMAMPADGSGDAVPLALYPPGIDLSGLTIFDPVTGESVSGNGCSVSPSLMSSAQDSEIQPLDASPNGLSSIPNTGFYRVVRDGAHLVGITNGMSLSGVVSIPVELANGSGTVSTMSLTEDDSLVGNSIQTAPLASPLALIVDTTQMSNGIHQISASARWDILGSTNDESDSGLAEADSPPITVNIYNEISFPNWMPEFGELGDSLLIRATSAHASADWYIDVYDSQYSYIGTFGGHTDDGDIGVAWDLIGPYGESHTNDNFFIFVVTTVFNSSEVSVVTPKTYKHWEHWSGHGAWVAAEQHAWDGSIDHELLYEEQGGFVGAAQNAGWQVSPPPYQGEYNIAPYALNFGAGNPQGDADWANFRQALYNPSSRNLVYFGHGGPNGIGYNPANTNRYISAIEIGNALHTIPAGQTNRHSFRFVFLDGCSTAKGALPEAFGILHRENVPGGDYGAALMRYSAFVGWPKDKWIAILNGVYINYDHVNFISYIQLEMLGSGYSGSPQPIKQAIINASGYPNLYGFSADSLKVFGYWGLTFGLMN